MPSRDDHAVSEGWVRDVAISHQPASMKSRPTASPLRRRLVAASIVVVAGALIFTTQSVPSDEFAPPFALEDLERPASTITLAEFAGRPLIINFWASWCRPCIREMPALELVARSGAAKLAVLGINTRDHRGPALDFLESTSVTYPLAYDLSGNVGRNYGVFGMPATVIVGADGRRLHTFHGEVSYIQLRGILKERLGIELPLGGNAASNQRDLVSKIFDLNLTPLALVVLLGTALGFGAIHAVGPGHGKTVMMAYLAGTGGRPTDALLIGLVVAIMHTISVLVIGSILAVFDRPSLSEDLGLALSAGAGIVVACIGAHLLSRRWRAMFSKPREDRLPHAHHDQEEVGHLSRPLSRKGIATFAGSGAIVPSPSALAIVVAGFAVGEPLVGLAVLSAFSVGLAATLCAFGLACVYGSGMLKRSRFGASVEYLPLIGAVWLVVLGSVFALRALASM